MNKYSQKIHNRGYLKSTRRQLRRNPTSEEILLWQKLKERQLDGRKFRRQHSIGRWVVDFYCPAEKLVIELDGAHHFTEEGRANDQERDACLAGELSLKILRFPNSEIRDNMSGVLQTIQKYFTD